MKRLGFLTRQEIFNHAVQHLFGAAHIEVTAAAVR
jgi:hypothetical protein